MKTCTKCNQEFPANTEYFYNHAGRKDKLDTCCKVCHRTAKKEWFSNNKEVKAARDKARYEKKKHEILAVNREYYRKNKDKHRKKARKQRALRKDVYFEPYTEQQVLDLYGTNCNICSLPVDLTAPRQTGKPGWENGLHLDHLIPISKGGPDILSNVRATHGICNLNKSNKEQHEVQTA